MTRRFDRPTTGNLQSPAQLVRYFDKFLTAIEANFDAGDKADAALAAAVAAAADAAAAATTAASAATAAATAATAAATAQTTANTANTNAATAQTTADSKAKVTRASSAPGSPAVNDVWVDTSATPTVTKTWTGAVWSAAANVGATLGTDVNGTIKPANVSSLVDPLTVATAYIANNAVTNPTSAYTTGSVSVPATGTWTNIQTVTITATGAPINIVAAFYAGDSEYGAAFETDGQFQIVRDSTVVYGPVNVSKYLFGGAIKGTGPNSATILDQPSSGSRTYKLQAYLAATGTVLTPTYRSLVIMEAKK